MKSVLKEMFQWGLALLGAALLLNCVSFCFYHPVHELKREGGATPGLMYPHMWGLYGNEGFGIQVIDSNGYVNPDLPREESYYCIIGASHTEGFHTGRNKRYSDILNAKFGYTDSLKFYNIAHSGFYYDGIVKRFQGMIMEFPDMEGVVIEIATTNYPVANLKDASNQTGYTREDTISGLMGKLTFKDRCIIMIKNYFPLLRVLTSQFETYKDYMNVHESYNGLIDLDEYRGALSDTMDLIREEFSGEIVIVYHPTTTLDKNGNLVVDGSVTDEVFEDECGKHNITFINMGDSFKKAYSDNHDAAYGFWNTTMMTGHINDCGHKLIADELYTCFLEKGLN